MLNEKSMPPPPFPKKIKKKQNKRLGRRHEAVNNLFIFFNCDKYDDMIYTHIYHLETIEFAHT